MLKQIQSRRQTSVISYIVKRNLKINSQHRLKETTQSPSGLSSTYYINVTWVNLENSFKDLSMKNCVFIIFS
jgi:hypothetical protein